MSRLLKIAQKYSYNSIRNEFFPMWILVSTINKTYVSIKTTTMTKIPVRLTELFHNKKRIKQKKEDKSVKIKF